MIEFFHWLSFPVHPDKTLTEVVWEVTYLGFIWNTTSRTVRAPGTKLKNINEFARRIDLQAMTVRTLAGLVGKVQYVTQVHYHVIAHMVETQHFLSLLLKTVGWDQKVPLPPLVVEEVFHLMNQQSFLQMPIQALQVIQLETQGDAGPIGYAFIGPSQVGGLWSMWEAVNKLEGAPDMGSPGM